MLQCYLHHSGVFIVECADFSLFGFDVSVVEFDYVIPWWVANYQFVLELGLPQRKI